MSKTKRKQPEWLREEDKWAKRGVAKSPSRKRQKQEFLREIEDVENVYR